MTRKPKRFLSRFVAISIGLCLGWIAANVAFEQLPAGAAYGAAAAQPGETAHDHDEHLHSIEALTPGPGQTPWLGKVVAGAVLLFVAAAVLGPLVLSLKAPEPPERDEAHGHDDHAHGDKPHAH